MTIDNSAPAPDCKSVLTLWMLLTRESKVFDDRVNDLMWVGFLKRWTSFLSHIFSPLYMFFCPWILFSLMHCVELGLIRVGKSLLTFSVLYALALCLYIFLILFLHSWEHLYWAISNFYHRAVKVPFILKNVICWCLRRLLPLLS